MRGVGEDQTPTGDGSDALASALRDALGYRAARTVSVAPGRVESLSVKLPMGSMSVNAVPWAEVWLDGVSVGQTPLIDLPVEIGTHHVRMKSGAASLANCTIPPPRRSSRSR